MGLAPPCRPKRICNCNMRWTQADSPSLKHTPHGVKLFLSFLSIWWSFWTFLAASYGCLLMCCPHLRPAGRLSYLDAVVREVLRLYPTFGDGLLREASEDVQIGSYNVRGVGVRALHFPVASARGVGLWVCKQNAEPNIAFPCDELPDLTLSNPRMAECLLFSWVEGV